MEIYNITFWTKTFIEGNSSLGDPDFKASATITHFTEKTHEIFNIKLNDIGLKSLFGEFDIVRQNGFWQTSDLDSEELNQLKMNIIDELIHQLK
jgi:hypothetical protein